MGQSHIKVKIKHAGFAVSVCCFIKVFINPSIYNKILRSYLMSVYVGVVLSKKESNL